MLPAGHFVFSTSQHSRGRKTEKTRRDERAREIAASLSVTRRDRETSCCPLPKITKHCARARGPLTLTRATHSSPRLSAPRRLIRGEGASSTVRSAHIQLLLLSHFIILALYPHSILRFIRTWPLTVASDFTDTQNYFAKNKTSSNTFCFYFCSVYFSFFVCFCCFLKTCFFCLRYSFCFYYDFVCLQFLVLF